MLTSFSRISSLTMTSSILRPTVSKIYFNFGENIICPQSFDSIFGCCKKNSISPLSPKLNKVKHYQESLYGLFLNQKF